MKRFYFIILSITGLGFFTNANAQLTLTGTNYFQNFDSLNSGLPVGWLVCTNAHGTNVGTAAKLVTSPISWDSSTGQFINSASTSNGGTNLRGTESVATQATYTNRALAIRQTAAFGDPGAAFVLNLTNTSGMANFQLSVDFLMLSVQTRSTTWTVDYAIGNEPTNFTAIATFSDPGVFGATHSNIDFGNALDDQSSNVWIRVVALSASAGSGGSRDTFGLDNFSLSWTLRQPIITGITLVDGNVQIDFTGNASDSTASFTLQSTGQIFDAYNDADADITQISSGVFQAVCAVNDSQQFYRIKRQ